MRAILLATLLLVGCAQNPADNKPVATVSTSTPAPAGSPAPVAGSRYGFNGESSKVEFTGSKVTGKHEGGFKTFQGEIGLVDNNPEKSSVRVDIQTDSVYADDEKLTGHLKSDDFFDVTKFPEASFRSTSIQKAGDKYNLTGDLTLHGVTKNITFPADITVGSEAVTAKAEFSIKRTDFGIVYKGKADNLIREEVVIRLDLKGTPAP